MRVRVTGKRLLPKLHLRTPSNSLIGSHTTDVVPGVAGFRIIIRTPGATIWWGARNHLRLKKRAIKEGGFLSLFESGMRGFVTVVFWKNLRGPCLCVWPFAEVEALRSNAGLCGHCLFFPNL